MSDIFSCNTFNDIIENILYTKEGSTELLIINDEIITLDTLKTNVDCYTKKLIALGIKPGAGVGYTLPNCAETFYLILSISRLGAIAVPLFNMIPAQARVGIYLGCRVGHVICSDKECETLTETAQQMHAPFIVLPVSSFNDDADEAVSAMVIEDHLFKGTDENHPFMMATSSGTTGKPKMVMMSQGAGASVLKSSFEMAMPQGNNYSCMLAFPLSTSGILVLSGMMMAGVKQISTSDMSPVTYLQQVQKWKADSIAAPPAYYEAILGLPMLGQFDLTSVQGLYTGMDFFPNKLLNRIKDTFTHLNHVGIGYGLIETATVIMVWKAESEADFVNNTNELTMVAGTGNEVGIFNAEGTAVEDGVEGELWIKGKGVIKQYLGNIDENNTAFCDGWFKTGDHAKMIGDNTIALLGRNKYLIKRGGKSVSPVVIKEMVETIPEVLSAAVVGVPHELYGEMVWAYVVKDPQAELKSGAIMRVCRENLAPYMVPDNIIFIDEIPKNPGVGKVNFQQLIDQSKEELTRMMSVTQE
ncbi:MAG: acyl--CoA ligase [Fibrobacterales bacterium]